MENSLSIIHGNFCNFEEEELEFSLTYSNVS